MKWQSNFQFCYYLWVYFDVKSLLLADFCSLFSVVAELAVAHAAEKRLGIATFKDRAFYQGHSKRSKET